MADEERAVAEARAQNIGRLLEQAIPEDTFHCLTIFQFAEGVDPGFTIYISNADRQDAIHALEQTLIKLRQGKPEPIYSRSVERRLASQIKVDDVLAAFAGMDRPRRKEFLGRLCAAFCEHCGQETPGGNACYCQNDD